MGAWSCERVFHSRRLQFLDELGIGSRLSITLKFNRSGDLDRAFHRAGDLVVR